jgi:glycosyltransferase involved in cell wall biosynthesis
VKVVAATHFFPRGGSAYVARALARGLTALGDDVTLLSGTQPGLGDARAFYAGLDVHPVDAPQANFEDRADAPEPVFAALDDVGYRRQVGTWAGALRAVGAARADVLHLHHLTPLHAAARDAAPGVPVVGHLHGTELLMLEAIADGAAWPHAAAWRRRLCDWAAGSAKLFVAPGNRERAADLLEVGDDCLVTLPNGFDPVVFRPREVDRGAVWRRYLGAGAPRDDGPVIVYVGRFTEVKRISLLLEAFAAARPRMDASASLVLVGGHPGEVEGEHPADAVRRLDLGAAVRLAGWVPQEDLPEILGAADLLVLASARESFGQVLVEAMACGVPPVAAAAPGPAKIVDDGRTGWLVPVDDRDALAAALVDAVNRPEERAARGRAARRAALDRFAWPAIAERAADALAGVARPGDHRADARVAARARA